ncbi:hypothetical protein [Hymenobacter actinosclerus]|uniref:hypothetical protein n=1 Tax=Hymenobacter actinosclerus TaxID=82805 RepID=UPI0015A69710|nr:hypothetical protein [Hymenobacter actinosclerus]
MEPIDFAEFWVCVTDLTDFTPIYLKGSSLGDVLYKMEVALSVAKLLAPCRFSLQTLSRTDALDTLSQLVAEERFVKLNLLIV